MVEYHSFVIEINMYAYCSTNSFLASYPNISILYLGLLGFWYLMIICVILNLQCLKWIATRQKRSLFFFNTMRVLRSLSSDTVVLSLELKKQVILAMRELISIKVFLHLYSTDKSILNFTAVSRVANIAVKVSITLVIQVDQARGGRSWQTIFTKKRHNQTRLI